MQKGVGLVQVLALQVDKFTQRTDLHAVWVVRHSVLKVRSKVETYLPAHVDRSCGVVDSGL